ncbi:MAG TPA: hypothetical protein VLC93_09245, partial [Myxococcota bacterium]|nr:hypothetical protein [Myxococcota bacterium]
MNTAKLPAALPQAKADLRLRSTRANLLGQVSTSALLAAQGMPAAPPAKMQRGKPILPIDRLDIA